MNGCNAKKRMLNKIRTTIWKNQKKSAIKIAEKRVRGDLCKELAGLSFLGRILLVVRGKFR